MPFISYGTLGAKPGKGAELVAILTRPHTEMADLGCLVYEVGTTEDDPETVHVVEVWSSAEAHAASLQLDSVKAAIAEAMPLLNGEMTGARFGSAGSPIRNG